MNFRITSRPIEENRDHLAQLKSVSQSLNEKKFAVDVTDRRLRDAGHRKDIEAHVNRGHAGKATHLAKKLCRSLAVLAAPLDFQAGRR